MVYMTLSIYITKLKAWMDQIKGIVLYMLLEERKISLVA